MFAAGGVTLTSGGRIVYPELTGPSRFGTLEVWATLDDPSARATLMRFDNLEGGDPEYMRTIVARDEIRHERGDQEVLMESLRADVQLGALHHVVITVDLVNEEGQIYVDGRPLLDTPALLTASPQRGEHALSIAETTSVIQLHDMAIYDEPLTGAQIAEHCRCGFGPAGSQGKCVAP